MIDHRFSVQFNRSMLIGKREFLKHNRWRSFLKYYLPKYLGIYDVFESKILTEPKNLGNGEWEYSLKILKVKKYFLWINYANRTWN